LLYPLKFIPAYKHNIWGGRNLEKLGKALPEGKIAEAWEVSSHSDGLSIISNGIFQGFSLKELIEKCPQDVMGLEIWKHYKTYFPLLFKLIDANDKLSVQVHPDDDYARINENNRFGKHEAWYIIDAKPDAKIVYGLKPGMDKAVFSRSVCENKTESCLNYIDVFPGDTIDVQPGIVHAIGEGIVLAEIQQNSNLTYRVYDYNRLDDKGNSRPLHIKKALEVIDFNININMTKSKGLEIQIGSGSTKIYKLSNRYFSLELLNISEEFEVNTKGNKFCIYFFLEGEALIKYYEGTTYAKKGETVLIPASLGEYIIGGNFRALKTYVPDLQQDIISPLIKAGFSIDEIYGNVCRYD
jgi:mannose-6-phosphate isomerase